MSRLLMLLLFVGAATATMCILKEKKDDPEIHVIDVGDSKSSSEDPKFHVIEIEDSKSSSDESGVMAIDLRDRRRKRDLLIKARSKPFCTNDKDCEEGEVCVAYLRCLKIDGQISDTQSVKSATQT